MGLGTFIVVFNIGVSLGVFSVLLIVRYLVSKFVRSAETPPTIPPDRSALDHLPFQYRLYPKLKFDADPATLTTTLPKKKGQKIKIDVIEAKNIVSSDPNGKSDPYVQISIGDQKGRTRVIPATLNPQWNHTFIYEFRDPADTINLRIVDYDVNGSDDDLGWVILGSLEKLMVTGPVDNWYKISGVAQTAKGLVNATGELHVAVALLREDIISSELEECADVRGSMKKSKKPEKEEVDSGVDFLLKEVQKSTIALDAVGQVGIPELPRLSSTVKPESIDWLNILLQRMFRDMQFSKILANDLVHSLTKHLKNAELPSFLGEIKVLDVYLGTEIFVFDNFRAGSTSIPDELLIETDISYRGGFGITLSTEMYVNIPVPKAAILPVTIYVYVTHLAGKAHIRAPPKLVSPFSFCFVDPPFFDFVLQVNLGKSSKLKIDLRPAIAIGLKKSINRFLVYPSTVSFNIPYPGKKLSPSAHPYDPSPSKKSSKKTVRAPSESTSLVSKKFICMRYIQEAINAGDFGVVDEIFAPDVLVHGQSLKSQIVFHGRRGIKLHIRKLRSAFNPLQIEVEDMIADSNHLYMRWILSGKNKGTIWHISHPSGEDVQLHGYTIFSIKYGGTMIAEMWDFWSLDDMKTYLM
eukprot:TRINITY_DN162_c0_g1_i1.p1 TRINITY_DN162_c0_g1~~TRINITY_DN162_c0_g1_i1.p1  ORF type:complete len:636 (-),score=143.54 TRINITY_DN162_c0_g1_i1:128-2035(-)